MTIVFNPLKLPLVQIYTKFLWKLQTMALRRLSINCLNFTDNRIFLLLSEVAHTNNDSSIMYQF